ncbi:MAG TPA: hypothetical protein VK489_03785, partial [Ferruginibacter sp.]|nr:hypothetical protein [Ferruginibacter sp.]
MSRLLLVILAILSSQAFAQKDPKIFRISSSYTSFPDIERAKGHIYEKVLYPAAEHYYDSSVLIVVPPQLKAGK